LGKIKLIVATDFMGCFVHGNVLEHASRNQDCWGGGWGWEDLWAWMR